MRRGKSTAMWGLVAFAVCASVLVPTTAKAQTSEAEIGGPVALTTPDAPANKIIGGNSYTIEWTGGVAETRLQLWEGSARGWNIVDPAIPAIDGQYIWDSTGSFYGWHAFGAWVDPGTGPNDWYYVPGPDWLLVEPSPEVVNTPLVGLTAAPAGGDSVVRGNTYDITWVGGSDNATVQLWAGEKMIDEVPAGQGTYSWNTGTVLPGNYVLSAWVDPESLPADDWYYITAPGTLEITPEPATLCFLSLGGLALLRRRRKTSQT